LVDVVLGVSYAGWLFAPLNTGGELTADDMERFGACLEEYVINLRNTD